MRHLWFFCVLVFISCAKAQKKPSYISCKVVKDSVYVYAYNNYACHTHVIVKNLKSDTTKTFDCKPFETKKILSITKKTKVYKDFQYTMLYGTSLPLQRYDTLYNYALPFQKGKRYKVLQGQNTNFTHKGFRSKYAIDFKMNIGQVVCAMRDGVVVAVKENSNKGGSSKKYFNKANYVMLYHKDGLFTQYVHLKKNGVLVKKGDSVTKGQPIAYSGNTGMSTEPHLHFGVFKPTSKGFSSVPFILDSVPTIKYSKGKFAFHN